MYRSIFIAIALTTSVAVAAPPKALRTLKGHTDRVEVASISADNEHVITLSSDKTARLWDATGATIHTFGDAKNPARAVRFVTDGSLVAVIVGNDLQLWDVKANALKKSIANVKRVGYAAYDLQQMPMWVSPDGGAIATLSDSTLSVWNVAKGAAAFSVSGAWRMQPESEVFSPDSKQVVVALTKEYRLYDVTTGKQLKSLARTDSTDAVRGSAWLTTKFGAGGKLLLSFNANGGDLYAWSPSTGEVLLSTQLTITIGNKSAGSMDTYGRGLAFSPTGAQMLSFVGSASNSIAAVYDLAKGAKDYDLGGKPSILSATFNVAGTRIAATGFDKRLMVWDAANGKSLGVVVAHGELVSDLEFSNDGTRIVTASHDKTAKVWDVSAN